MPCNSEYLRPSEREEKLQHTAKLLVWVHAQIDLECPKWIREAASSIYGNADTVAELCRILKRLEPEKLEYLLTQKIRESRDLANWWEDHQETDRKREALEKLKEERIRIKYRKTEIPNALRNLIRAAEERENTMGDPIRLIETKANLAEAIRQSKEILQ